jgi:hypothetical protein
MIKLTLLARHFLYYFSPLNTYGKGCLERLTVYVKVQQLPTFFYPNMCRSQKSIILKKLTCLRK